jgi:DnaK suppressor protein
MAHLNQQQIESLEKQIAARRRELAAEIRAALEQSEEQRYKDLAGIVADVGDASLANMLIDLDTAIIERHVHELRDLEAARERIAGDSFGICVDCGAEIPYARLEALVTAQRCVRCQDRREKSNAGEPLPRL